MKSVFYNVITAIIAVLGIVGGIVLGNTVKIYDFNTLIMIYSWIGTALLCLIFYGIASALEYLEELGARQKNSSNTSISDNAFNGRSSTQPIIRDEKPLSKTPSENEWECPNCHSINLYNDSGECPNCHWVP